MPRYSLIINWNDNDREQGTFSWSGIADNEEKAEEAARDEMRGADPEIYGDDDDVGGSVVEITLGAVWKAQELEDSLRSLLKQVDAVADRCGWADQGEREAAREMLTELDAA
ncbi:hypothetical protein [uncultured Bosea sp.]|uniref:hypothetical protein n=1 Tax=uncultured Bosea sp. TaxID=211457 RepID=UPI0025FE2DE9|nr:hypothetical protein [uncultured Bosea sp.]